MPHGISGLKLYAPPAPQQTCRTSLFNPVPFKKKKSKLFNPATFKKKKSKFLSQ